MSADHGRSHKRIAAAVRVFRNRQRRLSTVEMLTPVEYELGQRLERVAE
ncbi:hypothetical protein [Streptomyces sp. NPDC059017]